MKNKLKIILLVLLFLNGFQITSLSQQLSNYVYSLSQEADLILTGKVVGQNSKWNETKTRIYTKATLQVDEYLKGNNNGSSIVITYPGGEVGDIGELYSHMPKFKDDEEVLVFLKKDENESGFKVLNGEKGKITVLSDPRTGEKVTASNVRLNYLKEQIKNYINEQ